EYGFDLSYRAFQNLLRELVFFHDIGKVSPRFQIERMKNTSLNGLIGESELSKTYRQHSFPGAFLFTVHLSEKYDLEENPILLIFPFMILSHHTRLKNPHQAYSRKEIKDFRNTIYTLFDLLDIEKQKIGAVPYALCKDGFPTRLNYDRAEVSILYNYLFSCLIKADSIATSYADTDTQAVTENLEKIEERISPSLYNRMQSAYEKKQKEFERKRREETGRKKK
ncbi:MAG: CRISPR-associated endonuclease Cas3'', partial [Candidatus Korarchaeota archaeon]|nr:CRISPR-associated endonuclease Cas3'' [Candidatus Korarchaeota archaeon]NIU85682.1 CRISPR-associated endonuclease Cas3'' [Candidatus Thorarchaeota archaeon]NIW15777.1 CRISPR-associated endonuclease Cas3'' [Candidatus Thorarchaeota archaeon]NIW53691.1 CRISPR-associated endonuclease Cas3'' [Candidatus Korarchaeota archaeon]